jgi:hypothetical protein
VPFHNDSHYFEVFQLFHQINLYEFSEVDSISDSEDLVSSDANLKDETWVMGHHIPCFFVCP